jgi:hypothetical protein
MGILDSNGRGGGPQEPPATPPTPAPRATETAPAPTAAGQIAARSDLQRRRDTLAEQVTELHWDLGGLTYEMAIRDHFRLDVLVRRAAVLQERDAELAEVERLLKMEQDGVVGACPQCSAPHSRAQLMERLPSSAATHDPSAQVMDGLLEPYPAQAADQTFGKAPQ